MQYSPREVEVRGALPLLVAQCFRVETSYGDDRPSWYIYRRVRETMGDDLNGYAQCYLFEVRPDGLHVCSHTDLIKISILKSQTVIAREDWEQHYVAFMKSVSEPWNVL